MDTGFIGTWYLLKTLIRLNRPDVARSIIAIETAPSWRTMLKHPQSPEDLTILPEFFAVEGAQYPGGMIPHPGWCSVGFWFYQALGGILPDPKHPGFQRVIIRPQVPPGLAWVKAEYESIRGPIATHWTREGKRFTLTVTIPPNMTALVHVPSSRPEEVRPPKRGCERVRSAEPGLASFVATSGTHRFDSQA